MNVVAFPVPTLAEVVGWRPEPELSETETVIAQGLADGRPESVTAINLGLTAADVHAAATRLMQRMDCATRAELVARLMRAGRIR